MPLHMSDRSSPPRSPTVASTSRPGGRGKYLYAFNGLTKYYYLILILYTAGACWALVWAVTGPQLPGGKRVLRTGGIPVNSFYSSLATSVLLTPAAILIRKISSDIALFHPFAIAARKPVRASDLDRIMDPGLLSLRTILSYSRFTALIQAVFMLSGAFFIPIGNLIVTTANYVPQTVGKAIVGLPSTSGGGMAMSIQMGGTTFNASTPQYDDFDFFLSTTSYVVKGSAITQSGVIASTASSLGPIQTTNLTYKMGVQYDGIVTYSWDSNCEAIKNNEVTYTVRYAPGFGVQMVNIPWPDGTMDGTLVGTPPTTWLWSSSPKTGSGIPIGGATYIISTGDVNTTVQPPEKSNLVITNGVWISLVKCTPSLSWHVSSCIWNGTVMTKCTQTPGTNTTVLDDAGLAALPAYMTAVPWKLYFDEDYVFGMPLIQVPLVYYAGYAGLGALQYRAPSLEDHDKLFGLVAQSLATVTTTGFYGTAVVPTFGQPDRLVYIDHIYIHGLVLFILLAVCLFGAADVILNIFNHLPFRKTSFLTIATAVRGPWWDKQLYGGCVLDESELRERNPMEVMFGVDAEAPEHVGFAPKVYPVEKESMYFGAVGDWK